MKTRWWNFFDSMVEIVFKPAAGGYIYRAPSLWLFAPGGHYVVNEEQKATLTGHHLRMLRVLFWMIVAGSAIGGPLTGVFRSDSLWPGLAISLLIGLAIGLGASMWLVYKVRPIIATLEPAHERITRADAFRTQAKASSTGTLIALLVIDVVMFLLAGSVFLTGPSGQYAIGWLGVLFFGACTIYTAMLFMAKREGSPA